MPFPTNTKQQPKTSLAKPPPPTHNALVVRSLQPVDREERRRVLQDVEYNIFAFPAGLVTCDFLSDSGTSAMTDIQWAAMLRGDESYGRNWGYYCLLDAFRDTFERGNNPRRVVQEMVMGSADTTSLYRDKLLIPQEGGFVNGGPTQLTRPNFFIVPQGRCAEALLFGTLRQMIAEQSPAMTGQKTGSPVIISNGFFDTTGANAAVAGFELQTFTQPGLNDPFPVELVGKENHFKGNLDVAATKAYLDAQTKNGMLGSTAMILLTITNNWAAAQPVSMANIVATSALAKEYSIPLFFDACRFAENAFFIQQFEPGYADKSIQEIVQDMFSHVDGFTISLKKDGMANMGGVLCFRDESEVFAKRYPGIGMRLKERQILGFGNDSYGGMSGRDLMAAATGLYEVVKQSYLHNRIHQVQRFAQKLHSQGVEVLLPPGGHAVYLDMDAFFRYCDRSPGDFASVGFVLELLERYGIRAAEAGPFGWEWDKKTSAEERAKIPNLVRLAVPRHVMAEEHIDYTVAAIVDLYHDRHAIPNVEIVRGKDMRLRHFSCGLRPVPVVPKMATTTYLAEATRQLSHLSRAVKQSPFEQVALNNALALSMAGWGDKTISKDTFSWVSEVSNDHAPYEYSVAIDQKSGEAELRFLVEAQATNNGVGAGQGDISDLRDSAILLSEQIGAKYSRHGASLARLEMIRDLFIPEVSKCDPQSLFVAWYSCALTKKSGPEWKIYLNPRIQGLDKAQEITRTAFHRLGLAKSWDMIESIMDPQDAVVYFSLDLLSDEVAARVKVYVKHPDTTASKIAQKVAALCPDASSTYEVERFCAAMSGGGTDALGPYKGKSLLTCFAFTSEAPERPAGTVHFPIVAYSDDDADVQGRVEEYLHTTGAAPAFREKYHRAISAVQRRPLYQGRGVHAWVSLKQKPGGKKVNTFYISPELFGPVGEPEVSDHVVREKRVVVDGTKEKEIVVGAKRDSGVFVEA